MVAKRRRKQAGTAANKKNGPPKRAVLKIIRKT